MQNAMERGGIMEPIVVVSAAVLVFYVFRTLLDTFLDLKEDGTWLTLKDTLEDVAACLRQLGSPGGDAYTSRKPPYRYAYCPIPGERRGGGLQPRDYQ